MRIAAVVVIAAVLLLALVGPVRGAPPVLPVQDGSATVSGLSAPTVDPGGSGTIGLTVHDPLDLPADAVELTAQVYAFNAYPGNATGPVPVGAFQLLPPAGSSSAVSNASLTSLQLPLGNLAANGSVAVAIPFSTSSGTAEGTYAVRISVAFSSGGASYLFESRGFFSGPAWENATTLPGGASTLNLSRLGVSGVVPETAVLVQSDPFTVWLYVLLGGAIVLAAAGGYYAARGGPGSLSGTRSDAPESRAPSALGNSRTRDGD